MVIPNLWRAKRSRNRRQFMPYAQLIMDSDSRYSRKTIWCRIC